MGETERGLNNSKHPGQITLHEYKEKLNPIQGMGEFKVPIGV
jgi:hypothetical protein